MGVVIVVLLAVPTLWAWNQASRRCGWFDAQTSACARPFTADEADDGRAKFELFDDLAGTGGRIVGFSVTNNTESERSLAWTDVELETSDGRGIDCYWETTPCPDSGPWSGSA